MERTANGFTALTAWDDVRARAATDGVLWYWGALMLRPGQVRVVKLHKNGKIRVRSGNLAFTLDHRHLLAGLLYRRT